MDAFFSFEPWFDITGLTSQDDHAAQAISLVLGKKLKECHFQDAFEALVRNIAIYGHAGIKVDWNWDFKVLTKPVPVYAQDALGQPVLDPNTGQPIVLSYKPQTFKVPMACPRITPIDVYDLMVDPDGGIVAQLTERTFIELKREAEAYLEATGKPLYDMKVLSELENTIITQYPTEYDTIIIRLAELWNVYDGTCTVITFGEDSEALAWKDLRASYRATAYSPYKRKVYAGPAKALWYGPNQFDHKRNPILHTSYIKLPHEIYGLGAIEIITDLTESLNKFVNMVTDNWNLGINRRFAYDLNADIDHEALNQFNVPGGKVPVNGDPNKVIAPLPLFTPNQGDYAILDLYKGMIEQSSGISDFYGKGVGSPTGNKTATGISSIISESNFRFKMFIRNLEMDILQPLLAMCVSMIQQFMTDEEEVAMTHQPPSFPKWQMIDPSEIIGNFEFNLVAANYVDSKEIRQRNLMAFENIAQQSPYWKQGEGLRELGKVMEIRNINDLLKTDQEVAIEQEQQQQQQMQMALLEKTVNTEAAVEVAKHKGTMGGGGGPTSRPLKAPRTGKHPGGRPPTRQHEGSIPGSGKTSIARIQAQNHGANAVGLGQMGEVNTG